MRPWLQEISGDEALHAEKLKDRILALVGTPAMAFVAAMLDAVQ